MSAFILLHGKYGRGKFAIVDAADVPHLIGIRWYVSKSGYAHSVKLGMMHRLLVSTTTGISVDHANRNRLDNRRSNLRPATASQNRANCGQRSHSKQPYKGVRGHKHGSFSARIRFNNKEIYIGTYPTAERAAIEYDRWALDLFGRFAGINGAFYVSK